MWGRQRPEYWTVGGLFGYLAVCALFLAFLTAPTLVAAAVFGAAVLEMAETVTTRCPTSSRKWRSRRSTSGAPRRGTERTS